MHDQVQAPTDERIIRAREGWDSHPLHQFFQMRLDALDNGYARCYMQAGAHNRGGVHGAAHGGVLAFLCDVAALAAIRTVVETSERAAGTAELNISYLSPATGSVVAEARVLRKGRTLVVTDIDLKDESGKFVAKARVSYALHPLEIAEPHRDGRTERDGWGAG